MLLLYTKKLYDTHSESEKTHQLLCLHLTLEKRIDKWSSYTISMQNYDNFLNPSHQAQIQLQLYYFKKWF